MRAVIVQDRLKRAAVVLNPDVPESAIDEAFKQIVAIFQYLNGVIERPEWSPASRRSVVLPENNGW